MTDLQNKVKKAWETIEAQNPGILDAPKKKSSKKRVAASLTQQLYSRIDEISDKECERVSFVMRWLIEMGLYALEKDFNSDLHSLIHHLIVTPEVWNKGGAKSKYAGLERDGNVIFYPFPQQGAGQGA
jgi:hypothetical protein